MHLQHEIPFKFGFLRAHKRIGDQRSPAKQPARLSYAIDRFSDPNRAALRHSTDSRFGSRRRSHHANQQPTHATHPVDGPMR
jgi:hypothetical protein